ncbi:MAG: hypothetical protein HOM25_14740 [Rhodospirillaceae bacterium]|jgi:hypothetical protein|nr:hypothetical protein [Rhodospirillaceae bacterium]
MSIAWIAILAVAALVGLNPATWYVDPELGAIQTVHQDGAPHTDRRGQPMARYDAVRSFLPIGVYHGLTGTHQGRNYDFATLKQAGFNTVHGWEGQTLAPLHAAASRRGLQLIYHNPTDADVLAGRDSESILAWYLDEEPTLRQWDPDWTERLATFKARRDRIREMDPGRAVFVLDTPYIDPPWRERWLAWNRAGDVSAHWNYPLTGKSTNALTGRRGVPETVATAVDAVAGQKPVWLVVQAFASPLWDWRMPKEAELRAMVYAGIVHGATGIIYFAHDSFVTRDGQVLGAAPRAEIDYGDSPDYNRDGEPPLTVSQEDVANSRLLWSAIARLNGELTRLAPAILSPTARVDYAVEIEGGADGGDAPVRTLLKDTGEGLVLIAVNVENKPVRVRFSFPKSVGTPKPYFSGQAESRINDGTESFAPFAVKVFAFVRRAGS